MLSKLCTLLYRKIWTFRQPLSYCPKRNHAQVSDLFIWRNSDEYQTFFELVELFGFNSEVNLEMNRKVRFQFYNVDGDSVLSILLDSLSYKRQTINLSQYLPISVGPIGTFCVFHGPTPSEISSFGSFLTERGYVSYRYRNAPLRSYIHGNYDAVALYEGVDREFLGGKSIFQREYRLQLRCVTGTNYEFALINTTPISQIVEALAYSNANGKLVWRQRGVLCPGSIYLFKPQVFTTPSFRIIFKSHITMARPLVFSIQNEKLDAFHG